MDETRIPDELPIEPDILIQDLEDIPQEPFPDAAQDVLPRCRRCGELCEEGETYCAQCLPLIRAFPIRHGAVVGALVCVLVCLVSLFFLGANLLISRQVARGNEAMQQDDVQAASHAYLNAFNVSSRLNALLFSGRQQTFFTPGAQTICKQILTMRQYNGAVQAGTLTVQCFGENPPRSLQGVYEEYRQIVAFTQAMSRATEDYAEQLGGSRPRYEDQAALVDQVAEKLPDTPAYMAAYYRFETSYSLADDYARSAKLLAQLEEIAPNELWLYASEGIRAYDLAGEYEKGFSICSRLMALDASNSATIAYTMSQLRLLDMWDDALMIYDKALEKTQPSSEMERQRAIVLMLQGDLPQALDVLVSAYSPETASLEHVATICVCAFAQGDQTAYEEYKAILDSYAAFEQVDLFAAGECTLEEIFMTGGGEIR